MQYLLLVYSDEQAWTEETRAHCYEKSFALVGELKSQGKCLSANPLHPVETATSVRIRDDKRMITDGPFAETREQLGGYYLVEAADLDEAISIAQRIPAAKIGTVEVRPVLEVPGLSDRA